MMKKSTPLRSALQMSEEIQKLPEFIEDTKKLGQYVSEFVTDFFPAYTLTNKSIESMKLEDSVEKLNSFIFYNIIECSIYNVEDRLEFFSEKLQRLFTAAYAIRQRVCYGIVSQEGKTSLLLGIDPSSDDEAIKSVVEGLLPGIKLEKRSEKFKNSQYTSEDQTRHDKDRHIGCISGVPALKVDGQFLHKDIASLIRSLNGWDYTIMIMCNPIDTGDIQTLIDKAVQIKDNCFAISKRTLSMQSGSTHGTSHSNQQGEADNNGVVQNSGSTFSGGGIGAAGGAAAGALAGSAVPVIGTVAGAIVGGLVGLIAGKQVTINKGKSKNSSHTTSKSYSDAVSESICKNKSISGDIQNGYAIDLMNMAESVINRLKIGRSIGMWQSVISYSSDNERAAKIIQGSLYGEIASGLPDVLPPVVFEYVDRSENGKNKACVHNQQLIIPEGFFEGKSEELLHSLVTSEELCGICTIPTDETFGFDIRESRGYAINSKYEAGEIEIGHICEYDRELKNIPYGLSTEDLNKHTFVCGITGSGKTNTVKSILEKVPVPYLVIEPAKKEYRSMGDELAVYTLGRPEINCLQLNPFYILPGISPQQHIDLLKDLFSASFAFYGPMPYIVEKCINNIYIKKGWNLVLGFHPALTEKDSQNDLFNETALKKSYKTQSHKYLFPTMQDLKDEVDRYIEEELSYEGEVKGNIRGAIKARIDSLCIGTKGYMFNTYEPSDIEGLLSQKVVLELEGLSDDADKAFALGLLIIFVNEYRQVSKEGEDSKLGLKHILVIEEAHRLLKNIPYESNNEDVGNPKGKAVEHFTNMLAEMRSYGQGVIIAEQIPCKLAPDVIKNSSNKIVHRLVARDDQEAIANTIGVYPEDAIYLGSSKAGYALCHKEGMTQPVIVKISEYTRNNCIMDTKLYAEEKDIKLKKINCSLIRAAALNEISSWAVKFLVSVMCKDDKEIAQKVYDGISRAYEAIIHKVKLSGAVLIPGVNGKECVASCLYDEAVSLLVTGVFQTEKLPDDEFVELLNKMIIAPEDEKAVKLKESLKKFYSASPAKKACEIISGLLSAEYYGGYNIEKYIDDFSLYRIESLQSEVTSYLQAKRGEYSAFR